MKKLKKILLIDDDRVNNYLNETLLQDLDLAEEIVVLTDGKQGHTYLQEHCKTVGNCPELVILDHHMPVMDGLELMQELNASGFVECTDIVFVLLGIHSTQEHVAAFEKLGVQEFTTKPLCREVILETYHKYWGEPTANYHN